MPGQHLFRASIALFVLALCTSCAELETAQQAAIEAARKAAAVLQPSNGHWNDEPVSGPAKIVVNLTSQRAYFYKGKHLVGESTVSTGKHGFSTPPGSYRVLWKNKDHISTRFGDYVDDWGNVVKPNVDSRKDSKPPGSHFDGARMPYAMFFRGGYAMHQGYVPPYAASHGCIRLPHEMAERFFDATPLGTPVVVKE
jgi:lipoprotein-anchoring transpeptidase ErfK/SrfK